jgi:bisphosphoglycerate-dependent phosphoglycerate mutase
MSIYLARHGETFWNQEQRLQGLRDTPLNAAGIGQSRRLAEWHQMSASTPVVSSPLIRARRTAQILVGPSGPLLSQMLGYGRLTTAHGQICALLPLSTDSLTKLRHGIPVPKNSGFPTVNRCQRSVGAARVYLWIFLVATEGRCRRGE